MTKVDFYARLEKETGFFSHNQYHIEEISNDKIVLKAKITEESLNPYQIAHGGFIFGLGDTAMGMLVAQQEKLGVTLNASINYLYPAKGKEITAISKLIKKGKTVYYLRADIMDEDNKLIATMESNYYLISKKEGIKWQ